MRWHMLLWFGGSIRMAVAPRIAVDSYCSAHVHACMHARTCQADDDLYMCNEAVNILFLIDWFLGFFEVTHLLMIVSCILPNTFGFNIQL